MGDPVKIPLYLKRVLVAYATVDAEDYPLVAPFRWHPDSNGYAKANARQDSKPKTIMMHRLILGLTETSQCSDHINLDKLDNRRGNLRVVTAAQNNQNRRPRGLVSRFRGVTPHLRKNGKLKWEASVFTAGKRYYLGCFDREEEAGSAASAMRARIFPFSQESRPSSSAPKPIGSCDESAGTGA